jgi:type I restriction enzyme S subunit
MPLVEELTGRLDSSNLEKLGKVKKGYTRFIEGDVLFAKITPCMENGKVAIAANLHGGIGTGSTEFHVLRPRGDISNQYILYYLLQNAYRGDAQHNMTGMVGQKRVPAKYVQDSEIPLAPLAEQQRIVSKLEELFSRLDEGEAALKRTQRLLTTYRQSVLKAAVTGELTKDWRAANHHRPKSGADLLARILAARRAQYQGRGRYEEPRPPDTTGLPDLPEGWKWVRMEQLASVTGGITKNAKRGSHATTRPMLRVANVYQNRLDLDDVHEIGVTESELDRVTLEDGDLLIVEGNGSKDQIGRMAIWNNQIPNCIHQNHLIKARFTEKRLAAYVLTWFMSYQGRDIIEKVASSTSGLYTLSLSKVDELIVPLPSLEEAEEIVSQVDEVLSRIAALQTWCATELARSATLRQSILKAAFSGQLVPQDPADEPASALLARLRAGGQPTQPKPVRTRPPRQAELWDPS